MQDPNRERVSEREQSTGDAVASGAKTAGRLLLWVVVAVCVVALLIGVILLGPLGLIIVVPAVLAIWVVAGITAGGPAAGA